MYDDIASSATRTDDYRVRCGSCKRYHATASNVRDCYAQMAEFEAEAKAEALAEAAQMAYYEGGWDTTGEYSANL